MESVSLTSDPFSIAPCVEDDRLIEALAEVVHVIDAALHACGHPLTGGTPAVAEHSHVQWAVGSIKRLLWLLHYADALAYEHHARARSSHAHGDRVTLLFAHLRTLCPLNEALGIPAEHPFDTPSKRRRS